MEHCLSKPSSSREERKETTKDLYHSPLLYTFVCNIVGCLGVALQFALNHHLHCSLPVASLLAEHHAGYMTSVNSYKAWVT